MNIDITLHITIDVVLVLVFVSMIMLTLIVVLVQEYQYSFAHIITMHVSLHANIDFTNHICIGVCVRIRNATLCPQDGSMMTISNPLLPLETSNGSESYTNRNVPA